MTDLSDEELVERFRAEGGPPQGNRYLDSLFERHYERVSWWCIRFTGDRDAALDLAQEIFASAFRHIDSFRGQSKFTTWLYTIARNRCLNEAKARSRRPEDAVDMDLEMPVADGESALSALERAQDTERFRRAMREELDETERRVIALHYVQELPLAAVTRLMGLDNKSGAKAYVVSARRKLARVLGRGAGA